MGQLYFFSLAHCAELHSFTQKKGDWALGGEASLLVS